MYPYEDDDEGMELNFFESVGVLGAIVVLPPIVLRVLKIVRTLANCVLQLMRGLANIVLRIVCGVSNYALKTVLGSSTNKDDDGNNSDEKFDEEKIWRLMREFLSKGSRDVYKNRE